ncbi:MAG: helix-turn-helix domain-containing protein [Bacteroides sp.]|nr:helix-turn-helix domain-containing protein [Bacteroides sp.]
MADKTPADLIKEYRFSLVEKLLVTTQLSIDEILYRTGFANRGNFFKAFSARYGTTPKRFREMKKEEAGLEVKSNE